MLKVRNIALSSATTYGGAYECTVTFQVGEQTYNTVPVKLPPEMTREVAELAVKRATEMLVVIPTDIKIEGEPLPLIEEAPAPAPEFAEVDEAPTEEPLNAAAYEVTEAGQFRAVPEEIN